MEYFYLIYIIIPLMIVINVLKADSKETKKIRLIYAIPSILMILFIASLYFLQYIDVIDFIKIIDNEPKLFLLPMFLSVIPIIFYLSGRKKEKYIYIDMAISDAERARDRKNNNVVNIDIKSDDLEIF